MQTIGDKCLLYSTVKKLCDNFQHRDFETKDTRDIQGMHWIYNLWALGHEENIRQIGAKMFECQPKWKSVDFTDFSEI